MTDEEYVEPTNAQLARFLVVYAQRIPGTEGLQLSPPILESLMSTNPMFRKGALRHHRAFQEEINQVVARSDKGELPCSYIRPNGKRCPNFNEPGSLYCGLHKDAE